LFAGHDLGAADGKQVRDPFTFLSSAILLFSENGSLLMAPFGHAEAVVTCPLLGDERTSLQPVLRSVVDP
jgi:hypothetical protein